MEPQHRLLLDRCCVRLCEDLQLKPVLIYLKGVHIFQDWHIEEIEAKGSMMDRREYFVRLLKQRGPNAFGAFYNALIHSHQDHLSVMLEPGLPPDALLPSRPSDPAFFPQPLPPPAKEPAYLTFPGESSPSPKTSTSEAPTEVPTTQEAAEFARQYYRQYAEIEVEQTAAELENLRVVESDQGLISSLFRAGTNNNAAKFNADEVYNNFTKPKGLCLIFNNKVFENGVLPERHGTDVDARNAANLFSKLGYNVKIKHNHSARDMRDALARFALKDHSQYDSAIIVVLTHGLQGQLYGTCGSLVPVQFLTDALNANHCRKLIGKPKLFFLQACRGEKYDGGVSMPDGVGGSKVVPMEEGVGGLTHLQILQELNARDEADAAFIKKKVPVDADTLIAYATTPGFVSWRNSARGSWFMQAICEVFSEHAATDDIHSLLTKVNNRVVEAFTAQTGSGYKQIPDSSNRLRKRFFFFPGMEGPH